jgi:predicted acylesterase/phospholipase RssA
MTSITSETYDTLVLSGNSTNGIATLGALQKLHELHLLDDVLSYIGTSSGSITSALLAIEYDPLEILSYICANKVYSKIPGFSLNNLINKGSLIKFDYMEEILHNMIIEKLGYIPTLKQIKTYFNKSVTCVSYNITDNKREYVSHENYPDLLVTKALRMSSACPFIFEPFLYKDKYYIDGGITDNFAMDYAQRLSDRCIGVCNTNPTTPYTENCGYFNFIQNLFVILIHSPSEYVIPKPDSKIIRLEYESSFFNFNSSEMDLIKLFDVGYDKCKSYLQN